MNKPITTRALNADTLLLEWEPRIADDLLMDILTYQNIVEENFKDEVIECFSTYSSLAIHFNPAKTTLTQLIEEIDNLLPEKNSSIKSKTWELPVCYDSDSINDLVPFAEKKQLTVRQVIDFHTAPHYRVHFFGFLPGFMYLGGLCPNLYMPRKKTADRRVKCGSVAIGGSQTGIYPTDSPGGWHVIGHCPVNLFDVNQAPPTKIQPGDHIKFVAISEEKLQSIKHQIASGLYNLTPTTDA